ncbi:MAG: response regulator, partial [Gammaproteobacteria bacterium]|nr:response regulator [Gammaproteobacteria bacterium]
MAIADGCKETILVVEDDQRMAFLLDYLLSREGYEVVNINPAMKQDALDAGEKRPKLIILGDQVSFENNHRMISRIRNHQEWKMVPILILIDNFIKEKMMSALDAGAND